MLIFGLTYWINARENKIDHRRLFVPDVDVSSVEDADHDALLLLELAGVRRGLDRCLHKFTQQTAREVN